MAAPAHNKLQDFPHQTQLLKPSSDETRSMHLHAPSHKVASLPFYGLLTLSPALEGEGTDLELPSNVPLYTLDTGRLPN